MPTYITPDLVPPVLALPTGSRRGTWALAGPGPLGATLTHRCRRHARTPTQRNATQLY